MVSISEKDLEALYQQGVRGSSAGFALIGRQVISRLKKTAPEVASKLAELLISDTGTRDVPRSATPVDSDSRLSLLREESNIVFERDPIWDSTIEDQLRGVLLEREKAKELIQAGLEPVRSLIFTGPPGVGKTLAANWLASKLNLPILTLDLASVMSSLLGKTGSNIKSVIEYAKTIPCVLLLDEFDAIAKRRDDDKDVGELKRLVNVLLQAIDEWPSTSILIAATNHPDMLDPAVWRRFELDIKFTTAPPSIIERLLVDSGVSPSISKKISQHLSAQTYSDINRLVTSAKKKSILSGSDLNEAIIAAALSVPQKEGEMLQSTRDMQIINLSMQGLSLRKIAAELNVSHPTVGKVVKGFKESNNG
ncbi:AAA family ATPase [Pseudomonas proteolytica]|uniref:AAA family ATPase n=1 Tax=Pseudomonas proteolytica TaxID=219574 RepID=UPI0014731F0F|nr:AAA family ATPase [Pseudomonas proteolytica]NMZ42176.1 AAA family ATPase [Pseudomonas proteolytica]